MAIELTGSIAPQGVDLLTVVDQDYVDFGSPTASKGLALIPTDSNELAVAEFLLCVDASGNVSKRTRTNAGGATKLNDLTSGDGAAVLSTLAGGITLSTDIASDDNLVSGLVLSESGEITKIGQTAPGTNEVLKWNGSKWAPAADSALDGSLYGALASANNWTADQTFSGGSGAISIADNSEVSVGDGGDLKIYHTSSDSYIAHAGVGDLKISTNTSGKTITIGNAVSEVVIGDNATVTGTLDVTGTTILATTTVGALTAASIGGLGSFSFEDSGGDKTVLTEGGPAGVNVTVTLPIHTTTLLGNNGAQRHQIGDNEVHTQVMGTTNSYFEWFADSSGDKKVMHIGPDNFSLYDVTDGTTPVFTALTTGTKAITTGSGPITLGGILNADAGIAVDTNNFTVDGASGAVLTASTLSAAGDFAIATNKFTVAAASGDTVVAGTLTVAGLLSGNGGINTLNSTDITTEAYYFTANVDTTAPAVSAYAGFSVQLEDDDNATGDATGDEKFTALVYTNVLNEVQSHGWCVMPKQDLATSGDAAKLDQGRQYVLTAIYDSSFVVTDQDAGIRGDMRVNSSGDLFICVS